MFEKLAKLMQERNLTIFQLSKETGIPQTTLYEWKAGKYKPKTEKILLLADYFGVTMEYFLRD